MKKRSVIVSNILVVAIILMTAMSLPAGPLRPPRPPRRMNVLLIVVDDLNNRLPIYQHPEVKAPNFERLAKRSVKFDHAYSQFPLCNPSRSSFLSGRRPETAGVLDQVTNPRQAMKDVVFLPQHFRQKGYFTARVGKVFHITQRGTESAVDFNFDDRASWDVSEDELEEVEKINAKPIELRRANIAGPSPQWGALTVTDDQTGDGIVARRTVKLMEQAASGNQPFFLAAGFRKPHVHWFAPKRYFDLYPPDRIQIPNEPANDTDDIPPIALARRPDIRIPPDQRKEAIAAYYACISFMDAQLGLLLDSLDRLKLWDNTVVVVVSDHGYNLGEHGGLFEKQTLFEQTVRAPLLVAAPGKRKGIASPGIVEFVDIYPTLAELCGLPQPAGLEGTSFAPLLDEPLRLWKKAAFTVVARTASRGRFAPGDMVAHSVRTHRYRYNEWGDQKTAELYDYVTDPHEYTNLINDPKFKKTAAEMRQMLKDGWRGALPPARRKLR
ncbi:MAG: sulfatase [Acidobacteria bacterium]|nr:sulfatase [Acidobacteriota bacterium]